MGAVNKSLGALPPIQHNLGYIGRMSNDWWSMHGCENHSRLFFQTGQMFKVPDTTWHSLALTMQLGALPYIGLPKGDQESAGWKQSKVKVTCPKSQDSMDRKGIEPGSSDLWPDSLSIWQHCSPLYQSMWMWVSVPPSAKYNVCP